MKLSNEELKKCYFGAYRFRETKDGYLQAFQYTDEQMRYLESASDFWYDRCMASNAKTIEMVTNATQISFSYKIVWKGSEDTFELAVDGLVHSVYYVKDLDEEGILQFELPAGNKHIIIYLPIDATAVIKSFEINGSYEVPKKKEKVLWMGDSITQGYGTFRSSHIYVSVANRFLNYNIINQGIGGYVYDKNCLMNMEGYCPDKIIVSFGTNQYETESMKAVEEYYERLMELYGKEIPVLCITPIWRGDAPERLPKLVDFSEKLQRICEGYKNVKIVDGFTLVPHLTEYFMDGLHPNAFGGEIYGRNLVLAIEKLGF